VPSTSPRTAAWRSISSRTWPVPTSWTLRRERRA
jgi:hypothetical protein